MSPGKHKPRGSQFVVCGGNPGCLVVFGWENERLFSASNGQCPTLRMVTAEHICEDEMSVLT